MNKETVPTLVAGVIVGGIALAIIAFCIHEIRVERRRAAKRIDDHAERRRDRYNIRAGRRNGYPSDGGQ